MFTRIVLFISLGISLWLGPVNAWQIENYNVEINLRKDSRLDVIETIQADFGNESKHGIYRDIPTTYEDEKGRRFDVRFDVKSVTDQSQSNWPYMEQHQPNFKRIKIGSANRTISGKQTYVISYQVTGGILFLDDHDELFWNAVGTQWDVDIHHVFVSVNLPEGIAWKDIKLASYTGRKGSLTSNAQETIVNERLVTFEGSNYRPYEGVTIVVGIPKNILEMPVHSKEELTQNKSQGYWYLFIPVFMFVMLFKSWLRYGKDPQLNKSIVVEYKAPDDLKPGEMGAINDRNLDPRDISVTIVDLAIRGYLKIEQEKGWFGMKDYLFVRLKPFQGDEALKPYEIKILSGVFGESNESSEIKLSSLKNKFYKQVYLIDEALKGDERIEKYFKIHSLGFLFLYFFLGIITFGAAAVLNSFNPWLVIAFLLTGIMFFIFGAVMPRQSIERIEILSRIAGFKEFLLRTEKDKIQLADQQEIFERMLPYAICLGVSTKWAKTFEGIYAQPPQWFTGDYSGRFRHDQFIHNLDGSLRQMGASFYSSPQSTNSSGGFSSSSGGSGGGRGGGGGGSW